jgi:F-type H+-transporting ATPase subunit a
MGRTAFGLLGILHDPVGRSAAIHPAVGGGVPPSGLSTAIGEHSYYCPGKGWCSIGSTSFMGSQVNVDTIVLTVCAMVILILLALFVRRRLSLERPRGAQNVMEVIFEFVNGFVTDSLGAERARAIGPLAVALFLFILVANYFDVVPIPRFEAPTADINTTAGLALMAFVLWNALGVRRHGPIGYFKHVFSVPFLAPITVIEELAKLLTLALRLFGNIFAGGTLIIVFGSLLRGIFLPALPIGFAFALALGLFVGAIQAFIFSVLTVSYIGIATSSEAH